MTVRYNLAETAQLIAEAREDDARMTKAPWSSHRERVFERYADTGQKFTMFAVNSFEDRESNAAGIARTRNNLTAIADQLEAAQQRIAELEAEGCIVHYGSVHGGEAEELRKGIETIIESFANCENSSGMRGDLIKLLDRVDARDSLAHVELRDALRAIYPVYRACRTWDESPTWSGEAAKKLVNAYRTARAALTPDLIAAMGLEES